MWQGKGKSKAFELPDETSELEQQSLQVGLVTSVTQHPNADKLKVCMVDTGSAAVKVCGLPEYSDFCLPETKPVSKAVLVTSLGDMLYACKMRH